MFGGGGGGWGGWGGGGGVGGLVLEYPQHNFWFRNKNITCNL